MQDPESRLQLGVLFATLLSGCFITVALLLLVWNSEMHDEDEKFSSLMAGESKLVSQRISAVNEQVYSLSLFYSVSQNVDAEEFSTYTHDFLVRHPYVHSASYAHRVEKDIRGSFEDRMVTEGKAGFAVIEKLNDRFIPAQQREVYLPVQNIESSDAEPVWVPGFDLLSDPALVSPVKRAFASSHATVTPYSQGNKVNSYLLLKALYSDKLKAYGLEEAQKKLTGLLVLQIDALEMIKSPAVDDHLVISLALEMDDPSQTPVTLASLRTDQPDAPYYSRIKWQQSSYRISDSGQTMILTVKRPLYWNDLDWVVLILAALSGLVITALLLITVRSMMSRALELRQRNEQIQKMVDERTRQLDEEKSALEQAMVERDRLETDVLQVAKILDDSDNEIYVIDAASFFFIKVNKGARRNLGYSMDELRRMTPVDIKPEFSQADFEQAIEPLLSGEQDLLTFETIHARKDDTTYPVEVRLQLSTMRDASVFIAIIQDITERKVRERELIESEARYRTSTEHAPEAIVVVDAKTSLFVDANKKAEELFGYERADLFNLGPVDVSVPIQANGEAADKLASQYIREAATGTAQVFEWLHRNAEGKQIACEIRLALLPATGNSLLRASVTDISERKQAQAQMGKLSRALERAGDAVVITNRFGIIEYVNPAFEAMSGFTSQEAVGKNNNIVMSGKHDTHFYKKMWEILLSGEDYRDILINRKKDGTVYYEEKTISPLCDAAGKITHFVATGKDITERMQTQEQLYYLAHHDALTKLPNRAMFVERLTQALLHAQRHGRALAVMFLDMDRFKLINDSLGHDIGDLLLQEFGQRLVDCVRSSDTVARLGGDEFTMLLEDMSDPQDASTVADKVINTLKTPFNLNGHEFFMTTSMGISVYPGDGDDARSMLKNADTAMYRAKEHGRNNYQFYSADMSAIAVERLAMESQLRRALEKNEFVLYYQPKLNYRTGRITGAEALLRWVHPERGMVSPVDFIPLLEETGLIIPVGEWVLKTACAHFKAWQREGLPDIRLSVNVSARQLAQTDLVETARAVVAEYELAHGDLEFEITESIIMNNADATIEVLNHISDLGVVFSVDDFGTGYSSLAYLKRFPIQTIKIDRAFVNDITTDSDDESIVKAIISIAKSLKLEVIAEGVETEAQALFLEGYGCYYMQGFLFSKPLPAGEFTELLRNESAVSERSPELA